MSVFAYSRWRHGGWYVDNVRYPSGAVGCVSRNYPDHKWRIVCDSRPGDHTYLTRDDAAQAESALVAEAFRTACNGKSPDLAEGLVANKQLTLGTQRA